MASNTGPCFIDLFCGGGGFTRGLIEAGLEPVYAVDIDPYAIETYRSNLGWVETHIDDIRNIHSLDILYQVDKVDIVVASPPCESFTSVSQRLMDDPLDRLYTDPRGRLTLEAIRIILDLKPKIFIIENVPGILQPIIKKSIIREFERGGYRKIYFNILLAERYGCPSHRKRVFISNIPIHRDGIEEYRSVWDAIGDLGDPRYPTNIPNHDYVHISDKLYNRIVRLRWGEATQFFLGRGNKVYKQFIRLHPHRISPTVMGRSRFIHPFENRILTVREQARLMSFPDNHIFKGPVENMYNQVGEAVPPILSKYIGSFIIRFLKKYSLHSPY